MAAVEGATAAALATFLLERRAATGKPALLITGAGISTASGIPDYRGPDGLYAKGHRPMTYQEYIIPVNRRRYMARSFVGFNRLHRALPNVGHSAAALLRSRGVFSHIVTQNVDGLHPMALREVQQHLQLDPGHKDVLDAVTATEWDRAHEQSHAEVTELHGNIHQVVCLSCRAVTPRRALQKRLEAENFQLLSEQQSILHDASAARPDGDFAVPDSFIDRMSTVNCEACDGVLKPHVVFFGESVPKDAVDATFERVDDASCVVCAGTSLSVWSALRFVVRAKDRGIPVVVINNGETRADDFATLRIRGQLQLLLPAVAAAVDRQLPREA